MSPHHRTSTHPTARPARGPRSFAAAREEVGARRERHARDLQHDERFDVFRSRPARRALVVLGYLSMLGATTLTWWAPSGVPGMIPPLVFLLGVGVAFLLRRAVRHTDDVPDAALDERLVATRDAAHRTAYYIVVWVTLGALTALMLASGAGFSVVGRHLEALFYAFALLAVLTPVAVLAWSQPEV